MEEIIKQLNKENCEKSADSKTYNKMIKSYFNIVRIMLKEIKTNNIFEIANIILQTFQLLSFPFNPNLEYLWKESKSKYFYSFFRMWQLYACFSDNDPLYLVFIFIILIYVIFVFSLIIYTFYQFNRERIVSKWIYRFLAFAVYINISAGYFPILASFNSFYQWRIDEETNERYVRLSSNINLNSSIYKFYAIFIALGVIFHLFFSFLFTMTFFEINKKDNGPRTQLSPENDIFFLILKTFLIGFEFILNHQTYHWIPIVIFAFGFSFYLFRLITYSSNFNLDQAKLEITMNLIVLWAFVLLFITILFEYFIPFEGGFYLFILGCIIILAFGSMKSIDDYSNLFVSFEIIDSCHRTIVYIMTYFFLLEGTNRRKEIILKGYISHIEEKCFISNCPLKQYLYYKTKNKKYTEKVKKELKGYLYQHGRSLFEIAISRFPSSVYLKIFYISFLCKKLNKKDLANNLIISCNKQCHSLTEDFLLFCFEACIGENEINDDNNKSSEDISIILEHKNHCNQFNNYIIQASLLYIEFWTVVIKSDYNDFSKLNDYGSKISKLVEKIKFHFAQIVKLKLNNQSQMFTYIQFLKYVLNDHETINKILKKFNIDNESSLIPSETKKFVSGNNYNQYIMEENCYIRISSRDESFGLICNVSIRVCSMLGYSHSEIIGKSLQIVLPDFVSKKALQFLQYNYKKNLSQLLDPGTESSKELIFNKLLSFALNKSKYLVPMSVLYCFISDEENHNSILIQLKEEENKLSKDKDGICLILTNEYFVIQNFTSNCSTILDLTTTEMSNTVDITFLIQEFHQEYLNCVIDLEYNTLEEKLALKKKILETIFKTLSSVTWNLSPSLTRSISEHDMNLRQTNKKEMLMSYEMVKINNELLGYVFRFKTQMKNCSSLEFGFDSRKQNIDQNNFEFHIDKMFLPEASSHFSLNPDNMSYMYNSYLIRNEKYRDKIRYNAILKIKNQIQTDESTISCDDSSSVNSSMFNSSSNYTLESISEINGNESSEFLQSKKPTNKTSNKTATGTNPTESKVYYHVNVSKVKYMIYNYELNVAQEIKNPDKTSQIELRLRGSDEQDNKNLEFIKENTDLVLSKKNNKVSSMIKEDNSNELSFQDKLLNKQIQHALTHEEGLDLMLKMKIVVFIIFVLLIGFIILFIIIDLMLNEEIVSHYNTIAKGLRLFFNFSYGTYLARELILLQTEEFLPLFGSDKQDYMKNCSKEILNLYNDSVAILNFLSGEIISFDNDLLNELVIENTTMRSITKTRDVVSYNLSARGAFYETINVLRGIAELPHKEVIPTNKYVFFYMNNSLSEINIALAYQLRIFKIDLNRIKKKCYISISSVFLGTTLFLILSYVAIFYSLIHIFKQKTVFLEIFLEINAHVKKTLLCKCEYFYKQINNNFTNENEESEQFEDKLVLYTSSYQLTKSSSIAITENKTKNIRKSIIMSQEQKLINIFILIFFCFFEVVFLSIFFYLIIDFNKVSIKESSFIQLNHLHLFYIQYFVAVREFIFNSDRNLLVDGYPVDSYTTSLFQLILTTTSDLFKNHPSQNLLPNEALLNSDFPLCNYSREFFSQYYLNTNCHEVMGNSSLYGFIYAFDYFLNQNLFLKNYNFLFGNLNETIKYRYNNTLLGTPDYDKIKQSYNDPEDYEAYNSLHLFNKKEMRDMSIVVRFIFLPFFNDWLSKYHQGLEKAVDSFNSLLIIFVCVLSSIVLFVYIFLWKPFEKNLNKTITKTKNMLSIIPTEVLSSIKDIQKLLKINQSVVGNKHTHYKHTNIQG